MSHEKKVRKIKVKDLPKKEKDLTKEEQKKVKGGSGPGEGGLWDLNIKK